MSALSLPIGTFVNTGLTTVKWGPGSLKTLPEVLKNLRLASSSKSSDPKALILTGKTLSTKTNVIKSVEKILGSHHAFTFTEIGEHAPIAGIEKAVELMRAHGANCIVAVGGGSPIDSGKAVSFYVRDQESKVDASTDPASFIPLVAIPTTLSVAETTCNAGFTSKDGHKIGTRHTALAPQAIIYDSELTLDTPERLWLSTGLRALDHAVETLYRPDTNPLNHAQCFHAIKELFTFLPLCRKDPKNLDYRQRLMLAGFVSLWPENRAGALGLSHGLGHRLGASYKTGHGITSCLTLSKSIIYTARKDSTGALQLAALSSALSYIPAPYSTALPLEASSGSVEFDEAGARERGVKVGQAVQKLIDDLGLHSTLKGCGLEKGDVEKVTTMAVGEGKEASQEWKEVKELLESIYE